MSSAQETNVGFSPEFQQYLEKVSKQWYDLVHSQETNAAFSPEFQQYLEKVSKQWYDLVHSQETERAFKVAMRAILEKAEKIREEYERKSIQTQTDSMDSASTFLDQEYPEAIPMETEEEKEKRIIIEDIISEQSLYDLSLKDLETVQEIIEQARFSAKWEKMSAQERRVVIQLEHKKHVNKKEDEDDEEEVSH